MLGGWIKNVRRAAAGTGDALAADEMPDLAHGYVPPFLTDRDSTPQFAQGNGMK